MLLASAQSHATGTKRTSDTAGELFSFHVNNQNHETILLSSTHANREDRNHRVAMGCLGAIFTFKDEVALTLKMMRS